MGFAYDYTLFALNPYNSGTFEFTVGYDVIRSSDQYANPRFVKSF
jgi:hypothetical protein